MRRSVRCIFAIPWLIVASLPSAWAQTDQVDPRYTDVLTKVRGILIDADSARFRDIRSVVNSKGEEAVCGEVNARNRFGGYTGFTPFTFAKNEPLIVDTDRPETDYQYRLSGCAGPKAELIARYEDEATFNCTVIWTMLRNTIVEKQDPEQALDAAMHATKGRAEGNGVLLSQDQVTAIRMQYRQSLQATLTDKKQVKTIERSPTYQGQVFVQTCKLKTVEMFKAQVAGRP